MVHCYTTFEHLYWTFNGRSLPHQQLQRSVRRLFWERNVIGLRYIRWVVHAFALITVMLLYYIIYNQDLKTVELGMFSVIAMIHKFYEYISIKNRIEYICRYSNYIWSFKINKRWLDTLGYKVYIIPPPREEV